MARFYSGENFEREVAKQLRLLGHDVLTSAEAGNANISIGDGAVLAFAAQAGRIVLTHDHVDFVRLHKRRASDHFGIIVCSVDLDFRRLARRIGEAVSELPPMVNQLLRINFS